MQRLFRLPGSGTRWKRGALVAALLLPACADGPSAPVEPIDRSVKSVEIAPSAMTLMMGDSVQLLAIPRAADMTELTDRVVTWASSSSDIATVSAAGVLTARRDGRATIRAVVEGVEGQAEITVLDQAMPGNEPATVALLPSSAVAGRGPLTLRVLGRGFANGATVLWGGGQSPRPTTWVSAGELRAEIGADDLRAAGTVAVTVRNPGMVGTTTPLTFYISVEPVHSVRVTPAAAHLPVGGSVLLAAQAYAASGAPLEGRAFTWTSLSPAVASVDAVGRVTANHVGIALIRVESEGRTADASVEVLQPVTHVLVDPQSAGVLVDGQTQFTARTLGPGSTVLTGRTVRWSTLDESIATVDDRGVVTGIRKGITKVRAESEGKVGEATVEVRQYSSGPAQTYLYRRSDPMQPQFPVGTRTWVDAQGTSHEASLFLVSGRLNLNTSESGWEQVLGLDLLVPAYGVVGHEHWTDRGTWLYRMVDGVLLFTSTVTGTEFTGRGVGPGELILNQVVGETGERPYLYVIE